MIKGAIFDLDGTLLDSMYIWDTIAERYLLSKGREPKPDLSESIKKKSLWQACDFLRVDYGLPGTTDELVDEAIALVDDYYRYEFPLKPGAEAFLKLLAEQGVKMCVATADDRSLAEAALLRNGVLSYFSEIFTCNEIGSGKDEPYIYRAAADHLGFPHGEIMVFEDSLHAAETAKTDGFLTTGIYDEHEKNREDLEDLTDCFLMDFTDRDLFCEKFLS